MKRGVSTFLRARLTRGVFSGLPLTLFLLVTLFSVIPFLWLANAIIESSTITSFDLSITKYLFDHRSVSVSRALYLVTLSANQVTIIALTFPICLLLWIKKQRVYLYAFLLSLIGEEISVFLIKLYIGRDRPGSDFAYYLEHSKSFPSGHATIAVVFYGFIIYYILRKLTKKAVHLCTLLTGVAFIGLIGFSRVYLGVHYSSDVLGGFLLGSVWLMVAIFFCERTIYLISLRRK